MTSLLDLLKIWLCEETGENNFIKFIKNFIINA